MSTTPLPTPLAVREMLETLLGRDVQVDSGADKPSPALGLTVGVFVEKSLAVRALMVLDLPLSAACGAALGLIPAAGAAAAVADGVLTPLIADNVREIINVGGSLLNTPDAPHVTLDAVTLPGSPPPSDVAGLVTAFVPRLDLSVSVAGYGGGILSVVTP